MMVKVLFNEADFKLNGRYINTNPNFKSIIMEEKENDKILYRRCEMRIRHMF